VKNKKDCLAARKEKIMADNELTTLEPGTAVETLDQKQLKVFAEQKTSEILVKIEESAVRIQEAKESAEAASNMKTRIFGIGTKKKLNATAGALVKTNEAMAEMNVLIQEVIRFTCYSLKFAQVMHEAMKFMMENGFKDRDGNIQKISDESTEFVNTVIEQQEDYIAKQLAMEEKQESLEKKLEKLQKLINTQKAGRFWLVVSVILSIAAITISLWTLSNILP
jgi:hypothetical protein